MFMIGWLVIHDIEYLVVTIITLENEMIFMGSIDYPV